MASYASCIWRRPLRSPRRWCSAAARDGLEVNGKLFDWMGISSSAMEQSQREPQVAARAPLVLPPNSNRLPEPGSEEQDSERPCLAQRS